MQIAEKLEVTAELNISDFKHSSENDKKDIARRLIEKCKKLEVNPIDFNEGAWCLGARPVDLIFKGYMKL